MLSSRSLMMRMFISFSLVVITPLVIVLMISYSTFSRNVETKTKQYVQYYANRAVEAIEEQYNNLTKLTISIVNDGTLWPLLDQAGRQMTDYDRQQLGQNIYNVLSGYKYTDEYLVDLGLLTAKRQIYDTSPDYMIQGMLNNRQALSGSNSLESFASSRRVRSAYRMMDGKLMFLSKINHPQRFTQYYGTLMYEVDESMFRNIFIEKPEQYLTTVYVLNEADEAIYQEGDSLSPSRLRALHKSGTSDIKVDNDKYMVVSKHSAATDWQIHVIIPYSSMMKEANQLRNTYILIVMITYLCSLAITAILSRQVTDPLRKMIIAMRQLGNGSNDVSMELKGPLEVQEISQRFNTMNIQISQLIAGIRLEQKRAKEADLAALQAQISPHFLYNTLNLTIYLARKNKTQEIQTLTTSLIELLQHALKSKRFVTTIAGELGVIEHYVLLHQFRSEGKVRLYMQIDPSLLHVHMPKFLLQPLVENAIFHGIYPKDDSGSVTIVINRVRQRAIEIRVIDDGVGFDKPGRSGNRSSVGLNNVTQRVAHYYAQDEAGVQIFSQPGIGTTIVLQLPLLKKEEEVESIENSADHR
ncbi:sensor histidine kinase [Paenibacillus sp. GCM10027626]|uniref:sensor histidine kinase n=1 Tax=Paenibacillus sp. GCM10027626 TaxID=3273411 RepID=UPI0036345634